MSYQRDYDESPIDAEFKQKINVEYLVLKQIDRCNNAALEGDEIKFSNAVESLLAMLPKENRLRIESDKIKDSYITKIEQPVYKYSAGKPMGTIENPIYRNNPKDWNYDGGEPVLVSPTVEEVTQTDYQKLYKIILNELQDVGVTWKIEPRGNVEKRIDPPALPLLRLKNGSFVRVLIEKGISGVKEGIVKDAVEKPKTVEVRKDDAGTEPNSDTTTESESDTDDGDGEEINNPEELEDEAGEGETEASPDDETEDGEEQEETDKDEEENGIRSEVDEYDKLLEDAQDESLEAFKKRQKDKKEQDILMRKERLEFENRKIVTPIEIPEDEITKTKERVITEKVEPKTDKLSKEDEKALLKFNAKLKKKENKKNSIVESQNKIEENVDDKIQ